MKKLHTRMEKWGYMLLVPVCVGVIFFSALWTKRQDAGGAEGRQAVSDESQRLSAVAPSPVPSPGIAWDGSVLRGFSTAPVYFEALSVWQTHESVDLALAEGQAVTALMGGTVRVEGDTVYVDRENESERYRGLKEISVSTGQTVTVGERLGIGGGKIPFEGKGHLCVTFYENGAAVDGLAGTMP